MPTNPLRLEGVDQLDWVRGNGGGAVLATVDATDPRGGDYTLRVADGRVRLRRGGVGTVVATMGTTAIGSVDPLPALP